MADPYRSYLPSSSYDRVQQGNYPGYPPAEDYYTSRMAALRGVSSIPRSDVPVQSRAYGLEPRAYGLDGPTGVSHPALAGLGALPAGARPLETSPLEPPAVARPRGASPLEDQALVRRSSSLGRTATIPDIERPNPVLNVDQPSEDESNILFVDGLPTDCKRREVAHLFRPFVGFKDLRLVHKEPRRSGDKAYVLCFVEFNDAKCAFTAMQALQEYRFDERKPDAPVLKIQFARFPFCLPAAHDDRRIPSAR